MSIRLIAADIDGTLTDDARSVSERNIRAIEAARQKGVLVTLATGRGVKGTKAIADCIGLSGPAIQFGGAWVTDTRDGSTLLFHGMAPALVHDVLEYAHTLGVHAQIYQGDAVIYEKKSERAERYTAYQDLPFRVDPELRSKVCDNVPKVLVIVPAAAEPETRRLFTEKFAGRAAVSRSAPEYVEINAIGTTKENALQWLTDRLGIPQADTCALGDSYLDIGMLRWAGTGVCMANGVPEAKAAADVIAPACADDGLAQFIEQYVL